MTGLSAAELLAWNDATFVQWVGFVAQHPAVLHVACDVRENNDLRGLMHHIAMVELRYAQRLCGEAETAYDNVPQTMDAMAVAHAGMTERVERLLADAAYDWEVVMDFQTRSMGVLRASRRTVLVHTLMHSIRHYAQLATLTRQAGYKTDWPMDYLFMGVVGRA